MYVKCKRLQEEFDWISSDAYSYIDDFMCCLLQYIQHVLPCCQSNIVNNYKKVSLKV